MQLAALDTATVIEDMNIPGYRLHPLKGDRKGLWSITVNGNCLVCSVSISTPYNHSRQARRPGRAAGLRSNVSALSKRSLDAAQRNPGFLSCLAVPIAPYPRRRCEAAQRPRQPCLCLYAGAAEATHKGKALTSLRSSGRRGCGLPAWGASCGRLAWFWVRDSRRNPDAAQRNPGFFTHSATVSASPHIPASLRGRAAAVATLPQSACRRCRRNP